MKKNKVKCKGCGEERVRVENELIKELRDNNPYSNKDFFIFSPLSQMEVKVYVDVIKKAGLVVDKFSAHLCSIGWNNCVDQAELIQKEVRENGQ